MPALQNMYYVFTVMMLLLYVAVRWYQARFVAKDIFLDDSELFVWVNDALCSANPYIARAQPTNSFKSTAWISMSAKS